MMLLEKWGLQALRLSQIVLQIATECERYRRAAGQKIDAGAVAILEPVQLRFCVFEQK